jgi:NAD+ kinase
MVALAQSIGFSIVTENPDLVASFGGDGTLILSEHLYPGIHKIVLRDSAICKMCKFGSGNHENKEVLSRVRDGKFHIAEVWKLEARANGKLLIGLNDITVHNTDPRHGIRYKITVDGSMELHEVIGDGVVVATPFGSTWYYRSITDSYFETGIGLAFNNSTEQADHVVLAEQRTIVVKITRGPANIYADNQDEVIALETGESVTIKTAEDPARIVRVVG